MHVFWCLLKSFLFVNHNYSHLHFPFEKYTGVLVDILLGSAKCVLLVWRLIFVYPWPLQIVLIIHIPLTWRKFSFHEKLKFGTVSTFSTGCQNDTLLLYKDVLSLWVLDTSFRRFTCFHKTAKRSWEGVNLVGSLCYLYIALEEDVSWMILKLNELMEELLKSPPSKINSDDMWSVRTRRFWSTLSCMQLAGPTASKLLEVSSIKAAGPTHSLIAHQVRSSLQVCD